MPSPNFFTILWTRQYVYTSATPAQFANAKTFRADYPDDDFSDERVEFSVNRRRGWASAYEGAALIHLDRLDEATTVLDEAADLSTLSNYVGVPEFPLNRYWGKAELMQGRPERAAELLAILTKLMKKNQTNFTPPMAALRPLF